MAELVDALDSKSGYRKVVQVRFLFGAQQLNELKIKELHTRAALFFILFFSSVKTNLH